MKCPVCGWLLRDHHGRFVYDHGTGYPRVVKKPRIIFSCRWCRDLYTRSGRIFNVSYDPFKDKGPAKQSEGLNRLRDQVSANFS